MTNNTSPRKLPDLILAVKDEYFQEIKAGTKKHEYRLANDYWRKRLVGREYGRVVITSGYPKADDMSRRLTFPYKGYAIEQRTHKHFGAGEVTVFAIQLEPKP